MVPLGHDRHAAAGRRGQAAGDRGIGAARRNHGRRAGDTAPLEYNELAPVREPTVDSASLRPSGEPPETAMLLTRTNASSSTPGAFRELDDRGRRPRDHRAPPAVRPELRASDRSRSRSSSCCPTRPTTPTRRTPIMLNVSRAAASAGGCPRAGGPRLHNTCGRCRCSITESPGGQRCWSGCDGRDGWRRGGGGSALAERGPRAGGQRGRRRGGRGLTGRPGG